MLTHYRIIDGFSFNSLIQFVSILLNFLINVMNEAAHKHPISKLTGHVASSTVASIELKDLYSGNASLHY